MYIQSFWYNSYMEIKGKFLQKVSKLYIYSIL